MSRIGAVFWLGLAMTACVIMFMINYAVQSLQDDLNKVRKQTVAEQLEIRVLHAEWSYLTQPERLAQLNQKFLSLTPIATKQLQQTIAAIPMRPIAEPPVEEAASAPPAPASASGLELPAANGSGQGLDALFAQASGQLQPAPVAVPPVAATIPLDPAAPVPAPDQVFAQAPAKAQAAALLPVTKVSLTASARPALARPASAEPGLDALFAQVASER